MTGAFPPHFPIQHSTFSGQLIMTPAPASLQKLEELHSALQLNALVCLLPAEELLALNLGQEQQVCNGLGIDHYHYPIQDFGVPQNRASFDALAREVSERLLRGELIAVHCKAGIGRTSMFCIRTLQTLGVALDGAITIVRQSRHKTVPETPAQLAWLQD